MVRMNRLTERYLDIGTDGSSFPISYPFPDLFGNAEKSPSADTTAVIVILFNVERWFCVSSQ